MIAGSIRMMLRQQISQLECMLIKYTLFMETMICQSLSSFKFGQEFIGKYCRILITLFNEFTGHQLWLLKLHKIITIIFKLFAKEIIYK